VLLDVTPASSCVKRYAGRLATREPCRPRRRHHRHPVTELAPGQRADGASAVGCAQTVAPLSMKIESTTGPSRTGGARRYRRSPPRYPCSRHPRGHNTPTPGPQHANPDNPIATPADRPTPHLQQVANPKCHNPILNRYLKADLSCSAINGRHQRGSRRQMAACPRPARLGSCGGRRPAVTQPKRALASAVNPTTGSSPTAVSSWTATWSAPASRCSVRPAATVPASP
jgi:hypothetical protein